jgi:hypothetical protein
MARVRSLRALVQGRAGGACEYCRLVEFATGVTFHLEHVVPRAQDGPSSLANLALCCPGCNFAKAGRVTAPDRSGQLQRIYNPRTFEPSSLGWHIHFMLERSSGLIVPRSDIGEATVDALSMNDPSRVYARLLQIRAGLIS